MEWRNPWMASPPRPGRIWLDVGAHLGEKTLAEAQADPSLMIYAFEPNLRAAMRMVGKAPNYIVVPAAVGEIEGAADFYLNEYEEASSLLPLDPAGLQEWTGGERLRVRRVLTVPVIRLDTFMELAEINEVDFLKVDAQGMDLAVVRSAGNRIRNVRRICIEVQVTPRSVYKGATAKEEALDYLREAGFELESEEPQSLAQEENLTFVRCP